MSILENRIHRRIKHVQRHCTKCGSRMRKRIVQVAFGFDGKTGKPKDTSKTYWICIRGVPRNAAHDWQEK